MNIVREAIQSSDLPSDVQDAFQYLGKSSFDTNYLEFLDSQISLNTRGAEWSARLSRRRDNLSAYVGEILMNASARTPLGEYKVKVDPKRRKVVHWEVYEG